MSVCALPCWAQRVMGYQRGELWCSGSSPAAAEQVLDRRSACLRVCIACVWRRVGGRVTCCYAACCRERSHVEFEVDAVLEHVWHGPVEAHQAVYQ